MGPHETGGSVGDHARWDVERRATARDEVLEGVVATPEAVPNAEVATREHVAGHGVAVDAHVLAEEGGVDRHLIHAGLGPNVPGGLDCDHAARDVVGRGPAVHKVLEGLVGATKAVPDAHVDVGKFIAGSRVTVHRHVLSEERSVHRHGGDAAFGPHIAAVVAVLGAARRDGIEDRLGLGVTGVLPPSVTHVPVAVFVHVIHAFDVLRCRRVVGLVEAVTVNVVDVVDAVPDHFVVSKIKVQFVIFVVPVDHAKRENQHEGHSDGDEVGARRGSPHDGQPRREFVKFVIQAVVLGCGRLKRCGLSLFGIVFRLAHRISVGSVIRCIRIFVGGVLVAFLMFGS